jgi:tetratricopeptide (TPR) repeat protein
VAVHQARAARAEAAKAERVAGFLKDMLSSAAGRNGLSVQQMLQEAEPRLEQVWKDDPLTEAGLRLNLGASYVTFQQQEQARSQLERALSVYRALGDYQGAAITLYIMAQNEGLAGRLNSTALLYEQGLNSLRHIGKHAPLLWDFRLKHLLGHFLAEASNRRLPEARMLVEAAIAQGLHDATVARWELGTAEAEWGALLAAEGRDKGAETALRQATATVPGNPSVMEEVLQARIAAAARRQDFAAARDFARQHCELEAATFGAEHVWSARAKFDWARFRAETGETAQAMAQIREALPVVREYWSHGSDALWLPLAAAARVMVSAGYFDDAERYARESMDVVEQAHREEVDAWRAESLELLGVALLGKKRYPEAIPLLARAQAMYGQLGPAWTKTAGRVAMRLGEARRP